MHKGSKRKSEVLAELQEKHDNRVMNESSNSVFDEDKIQICDDDCEECKKDEKTEKVYIKLKKSGLINKWNQSVDKSRKSGNYSRISQSESFIASLDQQGLKILNDSLNLQNIEAYKEVVTDLKKQSKNAKKLKIED